MKYFLGVFLIAVLFSCKQNPPTEPIVLKDIDIQFSEYSRTHGYQEAFVHFAAKDAVLLKNKMFPIEGVNEIEGFYAQRPDTNQLVWKPLFAKISEAGDLGYTYGTWEYFLKGEDTAASEGCYVTIWEKQVDGSWKFVLDTGTSGLPE